MTKIEKKNLTVADVKRIGGLMEKDAIKQNADAQTMERDASLLTAEAIVAMCEYNQRLYIATNLRLFVMTGHGQFENVPLVIASEE